MEQEQKAQLAGNDNMQADDTIQQDESSQQTSNSPQTEDPATLSSYVQKSGPELDLDDTTALLT